MNLAIEILVLGGIVPGAIALAVLLLCRRLLPESVSLRNAASVAFGVAFLAGYVLLPSWAELLPSRHWHWFPYLSAMAMIVAPMALAAGVSAIERRLLHPILAFVAAGVLVPHWPEIETLRPVYVALLGGYLFVLTASLDALPARLLGPLFLGILTVVACSVAVLVALAVSNTFGQLGGVMTAATAGCLAAGIRHREATTNRGLIPAFTVAVGGLAFVGSIEPQEPIYSLLLVPAAPIALWSCAIGPLARLEGWRSAAVQMAVVLLPIVVAILLVMVRGGDEY